jgi:hypothetical protein
MAEYKSAIVTYLDILGFRQFVENNKTTPDKILSLLRLAKGVTGTLAFTFQQGKIKSRTVSQTFSDLIIRQLEYNEADFVNQLSQEMDTLANMQFRLLVSKGRTLIRGGMSEGHCYMEDGFVFGPAMVRSYELEQSAVFPRIIIDRNLIRELRDGITEAIQSMIRQGEDGIFFIDYFNTVVRSHSVILTPEQGHEMLSQHKAAAEYKLKQLSGEKDSVRQKAVWLAKYHNSVIERNYGINDRTIRYLIHGDKLT